MAFVELERFKKGEKMPSLILRSDGGKKTFQVGRSLEAFLVMEHGSVSKKHAELHLYEDGRVYVLDLGSVNGTVVGKKRIPRNTPTQLLPGIKMRFGDSSQEFRLKGAAGVSLAGNSLFVQSNKSNEKPLTKAIKYLLRHSAVEAGLKVRPDGFVKVWELLQCSALKTYNPTEEELNSIVNTCDPQWFEFSSDRMHIRSIAGHTIPVSVNIELREQIQDSSALQTIAHCTYFKHWNSIRAKGLVCEAPNQLNFYKTAPEPKTVPIGMEKAPELIVLVDVQFALDNGIELYIDAKQNVLSTGDRTNAIPVPMFHSVISATGARSMLMAPEEVQTHRRLYSERLEKQREEERKREELERKKREREEALRTKPEG